MKITPAKKVIGKVARVLKAEGDGFVSLDVEKLELTYEGVKNDYHAGTLRQSGAREPWYPRGTEMRNERQLSILSTKELSEVALTMGIERVDAGWIGANLVLDGIPSLTYLPPRTLLMFDGGVTIRVDGDNGPCKHAGAEIARHVGETADDLKNTETALNFVKAAKMKRGLVGWVEREGSISPGEGVTARIWHQWIYE